jgi:SAM-dependent methyltransferase
MPVTSQSLSDHTLYQRDQYKKGGLGRFYWDYRDKMALSFLDDKDFYIVDLGCGEGITLEKIVKSYPNAKVLGIDTLQENIEICEKYGLPVRKGDIYNIDLPANTLDAVVFMEVIEHLKEPILAINEIYRVLKSLGKLILVYPNDRIFKVARTIALRFKEASYDPGHLRQWTPQEIRHFLQSNGFNIIRCAFLPFLIWPLSLHGVVFATKRK